LATFAAAVGPAAHAGDFVLIDLNHDTFYESVLQTSTNTLWLRNAGQSGLRNYPSATSWASALAEGGSTQWRLPSFTELQSLYNTLVFDYGNVSNGPFVNVQQQRY
jgi:hypothetical protein